MNRSILSRILPLLLTIACAVAIFMFSRQSGMDSIRISNGLLRRLLAFWRDVPLTEITNAELRRYSRLIRKMAHFIIYFALGFCSYWSAYSLLSRFRKTAAFSFCVLYAASDELHQRYSIGRTGKIQDVFIDSTGAFLGILLSSTIASLIQRIRGRTA
ncbi:MAG: VanZ family protein [Ruminococcus sp.]|nr:VanZ family protein [Ruminococcus sp.]